MSSLIPRKFRKHLFHSQRILLSHLAVVARVVDEVDMTLDIIQGNEVVTTIMHMVGIIGS